MSPPQPPSAEPEIWKQCAGVKTLMIHSKVYYFPQGHLEHACSFPNPQAISILDGYPPSIPCIVSAVDLLADPQTDEVFAKLLLTPVTVNDSVQEPPLQVPDQEDQVVSFVKILTKSDSKICSRFTVPRQCAELIFPKLDLQAPLPSQKLIVTDIQGEVWEYTHSYLGNTKIHVLTTGWSSFMKKKKLIVGDSLVFIKNSEGKVFVGIRRNMKFAAPEAAAEQKKKEGKECQLELVEGKGFSMSGKKEMLTEKVVMDAVELAAKNTAFEVVYYPRPNWRDFVVDAHVVDDAMKIGWASGMRVKLPLKKDESKYIDSYHPRGTISTVSSVPNWRMLEVNWDEPDISQSPKRVNPWQVQLISHPPTMYQPLPSMKNPRLTLISDKKGNPSIPMTESLKESLWNRDYFPAGMQESEHDRLPESGSCNFVSNPMAGLNTFESKLVETNNNAKSVNPPGSIKLFGKIIQPVESNVHDSCTEEEPGCKGCDDIEHVDKS